MTGEQFMIAGGIVGMAVVVAVAGWVVCCVETALRELDEVKRRNLYGAPRG